MNSVNEGRYFISSKDEETKVLPQARVTTTRSYADRPLAFPCTESFLSRTASTHSPLCIYTPEIPFHGCSFMLSPSHLSIGVIPDVLMAAKPVVSCQGRGFA